MQIAEDRTIAAPPATVWAALFDPEVLKASVPGCSELTGSAEDGFDAVVTQKVGPVKATFRGTVTVTDRVEGESCTLTGSGKGGAAGFARGEARVTLAPTDDGGTVLSYQVDAKVGGKLAQLGSRVVDGFAKRMAGDFFTRLQQQIAPDAPDSMAEDGADTDTPGTDAEGDTANASGKGWFKRTFG